MERKIGETFEFEGKKLQVKESAFPGCDGCFFDEQSIPCSKNVSGYCGFRFRADKKKVIFVEAMEQEMETRTIQLTLEKAKEFYKKGGEFRDLVLSAFTEEELTKVELPKTWEEFCNNYKVQNDECYISSDSTIKRAFLPNNPRLICTDSNLLPNRQAAEAHLALIKLHQLRDCYRQGWKPDWPDKSPKWFICKNGNRTVVMTDFYYNTFLSFKSEETATLFLNNFRDLIKEAGDLI